MRVGFVTHCLPVPEANGGASTGWAILNTLREAGHQTGLFYVKEAFDQEDTPAHRAQLATMTEQVSAFPIPAQMPWPDWATASLPSKLARVMKDECLKPPFELLFPSHRLKAQLVEALAAFKPDVLFIYHWIAAAALHGVHLAPKMMVCGDLYHRPALTRWQQVRPQMSMAYLKRTVFALRDAAHHTRHMIEILNDAEAGGSFGAFDAAWLKDHGAPHSRYFRTPLLDECGPDWAARRAAHRLAKPKIITGVSTLHATSTSTALRLFAMEVFPVLERELGRDGFEVHVIGRGHAPEELARLLPHPAIRMRGYVEDIKPEFLSADVLLVPTPIFLGFRVRILTGFQYGCCVVAHTNEAINVPEIMHERNALLADDGPGLAREVIRALRDPDLRWRLGAAGRATYEEHFGARSAAPVVAELERLTVARNHAMSVLETHAL